MLNPVNDHLGAARSCVEITPHASDAISVTRAIMVNVGGDVACRLVDDSADVTLTLLAGAIYPLQVQYVRVTGTTATGIHGLY